MGKAEAMTAAAIKLVESVAIAKLDAKNKEIAELKAEIAKLKDDVEFHAMEVPSFWKSELDKANARAEMFRARWAECRRILIGLQAEMLKSSNHRVDGAADEQAKKEQGT